MADYCCNSRYGLHVRKHEPGTVRAGEDLLQERADVRRQRSLPQCDYQGWEKEGFVSCRCGRADPTWQSYVSKNEEFCIKNEELFTKNEALCIKNEELCTKSAELIRSWLTLQRPRPVTSAPTGMTDSTCPGEYVCKRI